MHSVRCDCLIKYTQHPYLHFGCKCTLLVVYVCVRWGGGVRLHAPTH